MGNSMLIGAFIFFLGVLFGFSFAVAIRGALVQESVDDDG